MGRAGTKNQRLGDNTNLLRNDVVLDFIANVKNADEIDWAYSQNVPKEHRRRFAQFFTPPSSASLMAEWVTENNPRELLDPALGTAILARAAAARLPELKVVGYEIDGAVAVAARKVADIVKLNLEIHEEDFLDSSDLDKYDSIIANPPYLRHQDLPESSRRISQIGKACGVRLSGLTNAYALFLLSCCCRLKPGGRLAFIIPTEWTNSNFGKPIKEYLIKNGILRSIIYVCHSNAVFEDALTTASIILVENSAPPIGSVRTVFVPSDTELPTLDTIFSNNEKRPDLLIRELSNDQLLNTSKWDGLIKRGDSIVPPGFVPLRELAKTKRGIATGANQFFHISKKRSKELGIREDRLIPCIGKANDASTLIFTNEDLHNLVEKDRPTHLIGFTGELTSAEKNYINHGEQNKIHERYLTKKRTPWYSNEKINIAPIWAAVFGRETMRFIVNEANAANLTAFHGVYPDSNDQVFVRALAATMNSKVVQNIMKSEMRVYGGGLNKLEPRDLLDVKVPDLRHCSRETLIAMSAVIGGTPRLHLSDEETNKLDELTLRAGREAKNNEQSPSSKASQPSRNLPDQLSFFLP